MSADSLLDRVLGRWNALWSSGVADGVGDHNGEGYVTLFKNALRLTNRCLEECAAAATTDAPDAEIEVRETPSCMRACEWGFTTLSWIIPGRERGSNDAVTVYELCIKTSGATPESPGRSLWLLRASRQRLATNPLQF